MYIFLIFFVCFSIFFFINVQKIDDLVATYQKTYTQLSTKAEVLSSTIDSSKIEKERLLNHKDIASEINNQIIDRRTSLNSLEENYVTKEEMNILIKYLNDILDKDYSNLANDISFNDINKIKNIAEGNNIKLTNMVSSKEDKINKVNDLDEADDNSYLIATSIPDEFTELFDKMYPIGSIYISLNGVKPIYGEWELIQEGVILWNTEEGGGEYLEPVLPNIVSGMGNYSRDYTSSGVFNYSHVGKSVKASGGGESYVSRYVNFKRYCTLYSGGPNDLNAPSIKTTMYKRIG